MSTGGRSDGIPSFPRPGQPPGRPAGHRAHRLAPARPADAGAGHRGAGRGRGAGRAGPSSGPRRGHRGDRAQRRCLRGRLARSERADPRRARPGPRHPVVRQLPRHHPRPGLQWVNPFTKRITVSVRIRNQETAQAKVNDADGNPIEIAAVTVWQVRDTAAATYAVDDYTVFVAIQAETAVRHIASAYPYDSRGTDKLSLRDNAEEITEQLTAELTDRVRPAGVHVIETRLTRLSYAPEIAQAMLRQQQASAVVGARTKIVEGAVGMVQLALKRLQDENVDLDEERKAAMVSNLLVVLCSEQATKQVVNTGSLYH